MLQPILTSLPNQLSLLRIILSPVFVVLFVSSDPLSRQISLVVFFVAALTDWYDGEIARKLGPITSVGKFLDPLADKVLTSCAFIAFASLHIMPWWMVIVIVFRDIGITVLRSIAETKNKPIITTKAAQTKTFVQMAALYYVLLIYILKEVWWVQMNAMNIVTSLLDPTLIYFLMLAVTLLTIYTGIQYVRNNLKWLFNSVSAKTDL